MLRKLIYTLCLPFLILALTGCEDDPLYNVYDFGEGEGTLNLSVTFTPLTIANNFVNESRGTSSGELIKTISDLTVLVYDKDKNLVKIYQEEELSDLHVASRENKGYNTTTAADAGPQGESQTDRATFKIENFPFGQYFIFAVANMGKITDSEEYRSLYATVEDLQKFEVEWNSDDIAANNQMFGYFTYDGNNDRTSKDFISPAPLSIGEKTMNVHCWLKRCASKLTIVYDGSGLHQGVNIYIKSLKLIDIPRYCHIGQTNEPTTLASDSMIAEGNIIYYDSEGMTNKEPSNDYHDWMHITWGHYPKGAVTLKTNPNYNPSTDNALDSMLVYTHQETDPALYFYENCQGNYENSPEKERYSKVPDWNTVGFNCTGPGQYDWKDDVEFGTYIEVEGYYVSTDTLQVSEGPIKYRFMLGQNTTYDYNTLRNSHYKLTLGFKGWANQPDFHIEYYQPKDTMEIEQVYYVSYTYNARAVFPIRLLGDVESLDVEIVENNWAPFDSTNNTTDHRYLDVPPAYQLAASRQEFDSFRWWKAVYLNEAISNSENILPLNDYSSLYTQSKPVSSYYSLQAPWSRDGSEHKNYSQEDIKKGAPEKVTPIWAGFITLRPGENLQANIQTDWSYSGDYAKFKKDFYENDQNWRTFSGKDFEFPTWTMEGGQAVSKTINEGTNMACTIVKAADGSTTVNLPVWTRPKSMCGISAFTGNNPFDTYQRRAILKLTATFKDKEEPVVIYKPIYQVRRIVNPKAVWRRYNDNHYFRVLLMHREGPGAATFDTFNSQGIWKAKIETVTPGAEGFISLSGGVSTDTDGGIIGASGSPVDFNIVFNKQGEENSAFCAIVKVYYHGLTCEHSVYVRQGYDEPLELVEGGAKWSAYSVYSFPDNTPFGTTWNPHTPPVSSDYINVELTKTPVALGTYFRLGNYAQGNAVANNNRDGLGNLEPPGSQNFILAAIDKPYSTTSSFQAAWNSMQSKNRTEAKAGWTWGRFHCDVNNRHRAYRVPTLEDFEQLRQNCDFGIGVLYADGAETTASVVRVAYEYWDANNDGSDDHNAPQYDTTPNNPTNKRAYGGASGMRGIIVYNPNNANQIFFPVGAKGVGRRTMQYIIFSSHGNNDYLGTLRYGSLPAPLQNGTDGANNYRPLAYNIPSAVGAIYWTEKANGANFGWDMNYQDMNFTPYETEAITFSTQSTNGRVAGSDALPIKVILEEDALHSHQ